MPCNMDGFDLIWLNPSLHMQMLLWQGFIGQLAVGQVTPSTLLRQAFASIVDPETVSLPALSKVLEGLGKQVSADSLQAQSLDQVLDFLVQVNPPLVLCPLIYSSASFFNPCIHCQSIQRTFFPELYTWTWTLLRICTPSLTLRKLLLAYGMEALQKK